MIDLEAEVAADSGATIDLNQLYRSFFAFINRMHFFNSRRYKNITSLMQLEPLIIELELQEVGSGTMTKAEVEHKIA